MFATARIELTPGAPVAKLTVPGEAIQTIHGKPTAFVERSAGSYEARTLDLGSESRGLVEVKAGLAAGERVVTRGAFALKSELLKDQLAGEE
jgi:cobalt-zinc-cadmium efflux system membrane fusion protein